MRSSLKAFGTVVLLLFVVTGAAISANRPDFELSDKQLQTITMAVNKAAHRFGLKNEAQDIRQHVLIVFWKSEKLTLDSPPSQLYSLAYKIASFEAIKYTRGQKNAPTKQIPYELAATDSATSKEAANAEDKVQAIKDALNGRQNEVLALWLKKTPNKEIALQLELTESRISQIIAKIKYKARIALSQNLRSKPTRNGAGPKGDGLQICP
jgi:RNA polymerase sigma factor (sigma-70 family)